MISDEHLYLAATTEFESDSLRAPALMAKCMALCEGSKEKAKYMYINERVEALREEETEEQCRQAEIQAAKEKERWSEYLDSVVQELKSMNWLCSEKKNGKWVAFGPNGQVKKFKSSHEILGFYQGLFPNRKTAQWQKYLDSVIQDLKHINWFCSGTKNGEWVASGPDGQIKTFKNSYELPGFYQELSPNTKTAQWQKYLDSVIQDLKHADWFCSEGKNGAWVASGPDGQVRRIFMSSADLLEFHQRLSLNTKTETRSSSLFALALYGDLPNQAPAISPKLPPTHAGSDLTTAQPSISGVGHDVGEAQGITIMPEKEQPPIVGPFYRWAARIIDLALWTPLALIIFVPALLAIDLNAGGLVIEASIPTFVISSAIFFSLLMVIDTLIGAMFGNTPGKSMMRICVTEPDGTSLTLSRRFKRNMGVATIGFGWSVPLFGWALMLAQYFITRTGRAATYDKAMGFSVSQSAQIEIWRGLLCAVIFVVAMLFQTLSVKLANEVANPHGWYIGLEAIIGNAMASL